MIVDCPQTAFPVVASLSFSNQTAFPVVTSPKRMGSSVTDSLLRMFGFVWAHPSNTLKGNLYVGGVCRWIGDCPY